MRILALQLKRIGDLILTTPALRALRLAWPDAHIALGVMDGCAPLLEAILSVNESIVFGRGRGWAPWQQALSGPWDFCLDFTGNDRSALAAALSRAAGRATFTSVQQNRVRALAYNIWSASQVRDEHTADHYLNLALQVAPPDQSPGIAVGDPSPMLSLPANARTSAAALLSEHGLEGPFALLHPGTARPEKFWLPERWGEVAAALRDSHGLPSVITGGRDPLELAHAAKLTGATMLNLAGKIDLLTLSALVERAAIVISCDTATVHLAAAFRTPQIALFGPTNPFHWRPRHDRAIVLSAAQPDAPLTDFRPRMKGAPMDGISTALVIRATKAVLGGKVSSA